MSNILTSNQRDCLKHMLQAYEVSLDERFTRSVASSMVKSFLTWICFHGIDKTYLEKINAFDIVSEPEQHKAFIEDLKNTFLSGKTHAKIND